MEVVTIICVVILCTQRVLAGFYSNYSLFEVTAYNERDRALLYNFHMKEQALAFFNLVTNQAAIPMKILMRNSHIQSFTQNLTDTNIEYVFDSEYLRKYDSEEVISDSFEPSENFISYDALVEWARKKFDAHPNFVQHRPIFAKTHEKREILVIKVTATRKPMCVYVVGTDNAREWMVPAIITNYINRLIAKFDFTQNVPSKNIHIQRNIQSSLLPQNLYDYYDFYFVPVLNPDGYTFSINKNQRFWMRNRQTFYPRKICLNGRDAIGVNIDRNWHLEKEFIGADSECNGIFSGHTPLSEQETAGLFSRLNKNAYKMVAFIHVRSFNRMLTIPYANSKHKSVNEDLMMEILPAVCHKLQKKFNETYYYGRTSAFIYNFSGNMADYVKDKLNIPMVLTVNLQHKDNFLPQRQDIPILTDHFVTILDETLLFAKDIYGPLFNSQTKSYTNMKTIVVLVLFNVLHILW